MSRRLAWTFCVSAISVLAAAPSVDAQFLGSKGPGVANPFVSQQGNQDKSAGQNGSAMALVREARRLEQSGKNGQAATTYEQALKLDGTNWHLLVSYARLKHRMGDLAGSIEMYRTSLTHHPNDPVALNDLGLCYARQGNMRNAVDTLQSAVTIQPKNPRYRNNLATVLVEAGRIDDAIAALKEPFGEPIAHYNVAYMLFQRQQINEAATLLEKATNLDPSLAPARQLLAQLGGPVGPGGHVQQVASNFPGTSQANTGKPAGNVQQVNAMTPDNSPMQISPANGSAPFKLPIIQR